MTRRIFTAGENRWPYNPLNHGFSLRSLLFQPPSPVGSGGLWTLASIFFLGSKEPRVLFRSVSGQRFLFTTVDIWYAQTIIEVVPSHHLAQILHQCFILEVTISLYGCTSEIGMLCHAVIYVSYALLIIAQDSLTPLITPCFSWSHSTQCIVPNFSRPQLQK